MKQQLRGIGRTQERKRLEDKRSLANHNTERVSTILCMEEVNAVLLIRPLNDILKYSILSMDQMCIQLPQ